MGKKFSDKQIHILNVAEEIIAQKGFEHTSLRDISSQAHVNVAMISYYFGSKDKMLFNLFEYRVQKAKVHFSEFTETIRDGKPEMQMKEIIKHLVMDFFKFNDFHGFITHEMRNHERVKDDLSEFYQLCVEKIDEVIKKGVASGVFNLTPKPEDVLSVILGTILFTIRNKDFVANYLPQKTEKQFLIQAEKKVKQNLLVTIFTSLGFVQP